MYTVAQDNPTNRSKRHSMTDAKPGEDLRFKKSAGQSEGETRKNPHRKIAKHKKRWLKNS